MCYHFIHNILAPQQAHLIDAFNRAIAQERNIVPFEFIHSYHLDENYINALVDSIKVRLKPDEFFDFFLITAFHCVMRIWAIIIVSTANKRPLPLWIN